MIIADKSAVALRAPKARASLLEPAHHQLLDALDFTLPPELEADAPAEMRGHGRDDVRLMVSYQHNDHVAHAAFRELPEFLEAGDLLVINTSATLPAALPARRADGTRIVLHLSTQLPGGLWTVEAREPAEHGTRPLFTMTPGERLELPGGATAVLHTPYRQAQPPRLWLATLDLPTPLFDFLSSFGAPIRYGYVRDEWPISAYQTVFATEPGSAEMPSAGRAFTPELITQLVARGVRIAPLTLHTGVASQEQGEPPYEEYYNVPAATARAVNETRAAGGRVIAVGTTVVRALESSAEPSGTVHPARGWTDLVITPERGVYAVHGLLTGLHEPRATHLAMLETFAGRAHLTTAYRAALAERYLWHEFGDLHLLLP